MQVFSLQSRNLRSGDPNQNVTATYATSPPLTVHTELHMSPVGNKSKAPIKKTAVTKQPSPTAQKRLKSGYSQKLCVQIEDDMRKQNFNLQMMQEEMYGIESGKPTELNVVYDVHKEDADR